MNRTDTPGFVEDVDFDVGGLGDADGPAHSSVLWVESRSADYGQSLPAGISWHHPGVIDMCRPAVPD